MWHGWGKGVRTASLRDPGAPTKLAEEIAVAVQTGGLGRETLSLFPRFLARAASAWRASCGRAGTRPWACEELGPFLRSAAQGAAVAASPVLKARVQS